MAYAAVELGGWLMWADRRAEGGRLRDDYRDLAWLAARSPLWEGARVESDFDYYERMSKWTRSGDWDDDGGTVGLQPESDPSTYNGAIWLRAREIFFAGNPDASLDPADPAYVNALAYYEERAYPPELLWDWSGDPDGLSRYKDLIADSDGSYREARLFVGLVIANHFLSTVDAFVSTRLRQIAGRPVETVTRLTPPGPPGPGESGPRLDVAVRIHW
jgi:hypothetical protein